MSDLTLRGRKLLFDYALRNVTRRSFYVALTTDEPTTETETFGELDEINTGNGYSAGGISLPRGTASFDNQVSSLEPNYFEQQLRDVVWVANNGSIPNGGNPIMAAVLTTDEGNRANRQVVAWWDIPSARVLSGLSLSLIDAFMRIGGNLDVANTPTRFEEGRATVTPGNNSKSAWVQIIASTSFEANELHISVTPPPPGSAPTQALGELDIGIGPSGSEEILIPNIRFGAVFASAIWATLTAFNFRAAISPGSRIAARIKGDSSQNDGQVRVQVIIGGAIKPCPPRHIMQS